MFPRSLTTICLTVALLPLAGCVGFHSEPISVEKNAALFEARTLDDSALKNFIAQNSKQEIAWPLAFWDFDKLVLAAFYYHPDIDVARAKWGVAKAGRITAGERPNPTFSFSPAYDTTTPPPWILGFNLDIPIETAGKRGYRIAQAKHLSEAARFNLASAAWNVRSRVRKTFVALYAANERHSLLQRQETIQADNLKLLEGQLEAGAASRFEVTHSRLALNNVRLALRDAEIQFAQTKVDLATAIGVPAAALGKIKISFDGIEKIPTKVAYDEIRRNALLNRADILGALAEYAAAESALRLEIAKQYPDVHLSPGYQLDQTDNKWGIGISATLPVFSWNKGSIKEAEARRKEFAAKFNALQAGAIGDIDRAFAGFNAVRQKNSTAQNSLRDQTKLAKSSQAMFEAGETSKVDLAAAQLELNTAKLNRLNTLVETQAALGSLEDAVQRPIDSAEPTFPLPQSQSKK